MKAWESKKEISRKEQRYKDRKIRVVFQYSSSTKRSGESCRFKIGRERFLMSAHCMWRDGVR